MYNLHNLLYSMWLNQKQGFGLQKNVAFVNGRIIVSLQSAILCSAVSLSFAKWKKQLSLRANSPAQRAPHLSHPTTPRTSPVYWTSCAGMFGTQRTALVGWMYLCRVYYHWRICTCERTGFYSTFDTSHIHVISVFSTWPYCECANRSYMSHEATSRFRHVETAFWLSVARTGPYPEGTNGW